MPFPIYPIPWWVLLLFVLWTVPWKGVALWRSARNGHRIWFIVLLVVNTLAILEIVYIFWFSKKESASASPQGPLGK